MIFMFAISLAIIIFMRVNNKVASKLTSLVSEPHAIYPSQTDKPMKFCRNHDKCRSQIKSSKDTVM